MIIRKTIKDGFEYQEDVEVIGQTGTFDIKNENHSISGNLISKTKSITHIESGKKVINNTWEEQMLIEYNNKIIDNL